MNPKTADSPPTSALITLTQKHITDAKLLDPFYESLEGLLTDLRTVTMVAKYLTSHSCPDGKLYHVIQDNRDAEAFLKPVSKSDVPDYHDGVIFLHVFLFMSP